METLLDMLRDRAAQILRQSEAALAMAQSGEGSSTGREIDLLLAEQEFLVALGHQVVASQT